jgi:hypothetical protein
MPINRRLLEIIGRRLPAIYDVIPHGPLARLDRVALNPQPLPPRELGAALASEFIRAAWLAERLGGDAGRAFDDLDDWCPTVPKRIKLPPWWPPLPDPDPDPDWFIDLHLGFAARLATCLGGLEDSRLGEVMHKAMDRSIASLEEATG